MADTEGEQPTMTPEMRYYYRHRDEKIARDLARYHNRPDVIAKRGERERLRAEKQLKTEAEKMAKKEAKRMEKERIVQEKLALAEATKRKLKEKNNDGLDIFLVQTSPAEIKLV
jgi:hypothetical protein